ncbi:MAG: hypothetical protein ACI4Q3_02060 [Kiritimatiellia bacterium]
MCKTHDMPEVAGQAGESRNMFDRIGDFFLRMIKGVLIFAFLKVPCFIWRNIINRKVWQLIKSFSRMCFYGALWLLLVFGMWMTFDLQTFISFWSFVGLGTVNALAWIWAIICTYANGAWVTVALLGSVYGIVAVRQRKSKPADGGSTSSDAAAPGTESVPALTSSPEEDAEKCNELK